MIPIHRIIVLQKKIMKYFLILLHSLLVNVFVSKAQVQTIYPDGLKTGDFAPVFSATANDGEVIDLKSELKKGSVVVMFYRGYWCPFCNKQLSQLNDSLQIITARGASVIAITPETEEGIKKTIEKTKTSIRIIEDKGLDIMMKYKVSFSVDENTVAKYKNYGIDFNITNGNNGANLLVPATYIIGKDGKIKYVFFNTDYRKRASIKDILDHL